MQLQTVASSPGSTPPLCFICVIILYTQNVHLNVGGGEPGDEAYADCV